MLILSSNYRSAQFIDINRRSIPLYYWWYVNCFYIRNNSYFSYRAQRTKHYNYFKITSTAMELNYYRFNYGEFCRVVCLSS